jgi:hypothetical protein
MVLTERDMKIKFLAKGIAPDFYTISGSVINGIDTAPFTEDAAFIGNEETKNAGIYGMEWVGGELLITLGQITKAYQFPVNSHDWAESDWIDAVNYDPSQCYVKATNPQAVELLDSGQAEYFQDTDGAWTVRMIEEVAV